MARKKILTVDDSLIIRKVVMKCAKALGCDVVEATNGAECLKVAANEKPDLIILDVNMPVMSGDEALVRLRQTPEIKNTPVIMLTTEARKEIVVELIKKGANQYIVKPFTPEVFYRKANAILSLYEGEFSPEKIALQGNSSKNAKVVLVIEDKENIVEQIRKALPSGLELRRATNAADAIAIAKAQNPQFVFIDLKLDGLDPLTLYADLLKILSPQGTEYVGMCLRTATDSIGAAHEKGLSHILPKPFSEDDVVGILASNDAEPELNTVGDTGVITLPQNSRKAKQRILGTEFNKIRDLVNEVAEQGYTKILLDFNSLGEVDIESIKILIRLDRQLTSLQLKRVFINSSSAVKKKLAGLAEAKDLPFVDDLDQAKKVLA